MADKHSANSHLNQGPDPRLHSCLHSRLTSPQYDVVIAGAGLTGAACALALAKTHGGASLKIALLEARGGGQNYTGNEFDPRVVAVTEASRRWLENLGVWQDITQRRICPYTRMVVRDAEGTGVIEFDSREVQQENLGHIVEHSVLLNGILSALAQSTNVEQLCPVTICAIKRCEPGVGFELSLENTAITAGLLVGADGSNSLVRSQLSFRERTWDYGHSAIVATIHTEREHDLVARQWFTPTGPLAFLPLQTESGDRHYTSIVWSQQNQAAEELMALADEEFCSTLQRVSEDTLGAITLPAPGSVKVPAARQSFRLQQRHAAQYMQPGAVLIGDAAHTIHPLAGLGVNLGFADVRVLVEELSRGLEKGLSVDAPSALGRYQRRRKPENLAAMATMEGFKRLFEAPSPLARVLRNAGMSRLNTLTAAKRSIIRQAMGIASGPG